jgi:ABC-type transport system involved in multi-copper enzyme maturation permease subunit
MTANETVDQPIARPALTERPGVPFGRQLRAEFRKLTDTRAGRWLLIVIFAAMPLVVAGALIFAKPNDLTYGQLINLTQAPEKILLPILGVLTVSSEWSQRTGLLTFALEPRRPRVLLAKILATLLLGLLVVIVAFASAAIGNILGTVLRDGTGSWAFNLAGYRDITVVLVSGLLEGLAYGMLFLITAAAIVAFYVLPNLVDLVFSSVSGLKEVAPWFDLNKAQAALYNHDVSSREWAQYLSACLIWVVVPGVIGWFRVMRSEVKSS